MEELTENDIDSCNLPRAIAILRRNHTDVGDAKSLQDLKCKLKASLLADRRPRNSIIHPLDENAEKDRCLREELENIYRSVIQYMEKCDKEKNPITDKICNHYPNYINYLVQQHHKLHGKTSRCPVLVLGETGAGKSSFINLLLGEEILPCSLLSNTNVICEIQYGDTYWASVQQQDSETCHKIKSAEKSDFIKELAKRIQVNDSDRRQEVYTRAAIYLPLDILKTGIVLVDSPGIGDTVRMKNLVMDYVMEASSFVYIINSANAGGVQPDRLQALLKEVKDKVFSDQGNYRPDCALFVCNKWDQVSMDQRQAVYEDTVSKLTGPLGWPGCKKSQIFCLSTKEAMYIQKEGYITGGFAKLVEEIHRLIPLGREIMLQQSASCLVRFLEKCCFCMESSIECANFTLDQREVYIKHEKDKFYKLKSDIDLFFKSQKKELSKEIQNLAGHLSTYLNQTDVKTAISDPNGYGISKDKEWADAMVEIRAELYSKLTHQIQTWERKNGRLDQMSREIADKFRSKFPEFDAKILQMERIFRESGSKDSIATDDGVTFVPGFIAQAFEPLGIGMKVLLGVSLSPVFLLGAIFRLPIYGILELKRKMSSMSMVSTFRGNPNIAVRKYAENTLKSIAEPANLTSLLLNELTPLFEYLDKQHDRLKGIINADIAIVQQVADNMKQQAVVLDKELFPLYKTHFEKLKGRVIYFQVMKLPTLKQMQKYFGIQYFDITEEILSQGILAQLVKAKANCCEELEDQKSIVIKQNKILIDESTILSFMDEEMAYICIKKPHITRTLGFIKTGQQIWQVLPPLVGTLRQHMSCRTSKSQMEAKRVHYLLMEQVVQGLQFLFDRGYVHIDLSLDTVMVDSEGRIKLVNINKPKILPRSFYPEEGDKLDVAQFVHFHPDILPLPERDECLYVDKHDMYAVGIMMYEIRSRQRAFKADIEHFAISTLTDFVKFLTRVEISLCFSENSALADDTKWQTTMNKCLQCKLTSKEWLKCLMESVKYE